MALSIFELFSIGIGPSSSHTIGPMRAAREFAILLQKQNKVSDTNVLKIELFGSLAYTGLGHNIDQAIALGLEGAIPEIVEPEYIASRMHEIQATKKLKLLNKKVIKHDSKQDILFEYKDKLPLHSNAMRFNAFDKENNLLLTAVYYSIGGGFILTDEGSAVNNNKKNNENDNVNKFNTMSELLELCKPNVNIYDIVLANERVWRSEQEIIYLANKIWQVMDNSIKNGCKATGFLPGKLQLARRAAKLIENLDKNNILNWLNIYAIAVNEENAAGKKIVTAPTNGAAGIVPAVFKFFEKFYLKDKNLKAKYWLRYLLTAGAIGLLFKQGASISGAEMGCQGEIGVASAMAAAGFTALKDGSPWQIENAAEIAIEHHLGLTCDPVAGLVQIPCIERNAMGAVKAFNAANLALSSNGQHKVSLDQAIATMKQTGLDMSSRYKETATGGLAVNVPNC